MDAPRTLDELVEALGTERRVRAEDLESAASGDNAFADILGLLKDATQQDIDFLHELAVHVAALRG